MLNNPLLYTDPSGELIVGVLVAVAAAVLIKAIDNVANGIPFWHGLGKTAVVTAIQPTISFGIGSIVPGPPMAADKLVDALLGSVFNSVMPKLDIKIGNWTLSVNLSILMGHSYGIGASASIAFDDGEFFFAAGFGITNFTDYNGMGINGWEYRASAMMGYGGKDARLTLGTNMWWGMKGLEGESLSQRTGVLGFQSGDFGLMYENDGAPFGGWSGDNGDKHRSAALSMSIGNYSVGFNIFTGHRDLEEEKNQELDKVPYQKGFFKRLFNKTPKGVDGGYGANLPYKATIEKGPQYRFATLYVGYKGLKLGIESYRYVGHPIQNIGAHHLARPQAGFPSLDNKINSYFQYHTPNPFTSW